MIVVALLRVGVGIEMGDGQRAVAVRVRSEQREGDGMIAAKRDDRRAAVDDAASLLRHQLNVLLDAGQLDREIAIIDDRQQVKGVESVSQVVALDQ